MAVINFQCQKCKKVFDFDVGEINFELVDERPQFKNTIRCDRCGELTLDEVWLTEIGQTQLTALQLEDEERKGRC